MKTQAPRGSSTTRPAAQRLARVARKAGTAGTDAASMRSILAAHGAQPSLSVSTPGDAFEVEADRVADHVAAGRAAPMISRLPQAGLTQRVDKPKPDDDKKTTQRKPNAAGDGERKKPLDPQKPDESKRAQRKPAHPEDAEKKPVQRKDARQEDPEKKPVQRKDAQREEPDKKPLQRKDAQREDPEKKPVQREAASGRSGLDDAAERAVASKGLGRPLEPATRSRLESSMGVDLGGVRVHDDAASRSAAESLGARAFTHGSDIWLGRGESQGDTRLMAHEATHVVQQQAGLAQRQVQRDPTDPPAPAATTTPQAASAAAGNVFPVEVFELPHIKTRHRDRYSEWANQRKLMRRHDFDRGDPGQRELWKQQVPLPPNWAQQLQVDPANPSAKVVTVNDNLVTLPSGRAELEEVIKIPTWDHEGGARRFDVDHMVELQVAGWPNATFGGNQLPNMELLDNRSNSSAGSATRLAVRDSVEAQLARTPQPGAPAGTPRTVSEDEITRTLATKDVVFSRVAMSTRGNRDDVQSRFWSLEEIQSGAHLRNVRPVRNLGEVGTASSFALLEPTRTVKLAEFPHSADHIAVPAAQRTGVLQGLNIDSIDLVPNYTDVRGNNKVAELHGTWNMQAGVAPANPAVTVDILRHSQYSGYLATLPAFTADARGASPVTFSPPQVEGRRVVASGQLHPTIPLFGNRPIELRLVGRELELSYAFDVGAISLPIPGVTIDESSLVLFCGTRGLGAEGTVVFSVNQLGSGSLTAAISTERGFEASGRFLFDRRLFDRAEIAVSYRNGAFGARGTLGIDDPQKIRGIRSAEISVGYEAGTFTASGRVAPSIPGVQEAGLTVAYSETEGLSIGGTLSLANSPGIRSGSLDVTLRKRDDAWKVSGSGRAQPAVPGIESELTVEYDDGAFNASFRGGFQRGMLTGTATLGVTNRTLDETGAPTGDPSPDDTLIVYGSGSATIRIAPWLQGTVGVVFSPNGELTVSGEIGLPGELEIFSRKQLERSLLNVAVQVPIIPGIVAEIGGGLSAEAGIGPGVIDRLRLGITYNPAHEDQTHVTGDAHLNIPADAGVRLAVRAGIGLGITGASATGGLEIGGLLGVGGAAEAGVHIDWTPTTGLRIDAFGELSAQPKFRFDISGYVSVRALGFSVYDHRWELAAFEFGSDLRVGARFPIHYVEGQPFDISLNDVEFIVPDINPREILHDLIERVA